MRNFNSYWIFAVFLAFPYLSNAQGKLLLVGGGSEDQNGWSDAPYQWAVDQSENKKVAIISISAGSDPEWLPNYFESLGAEYAKNFEVRSLDSANSDVLYDSLLKYDVLFFKGGDQYDYYRLYNDQKIEDAIIDVYQSGGVIGGTSAGMAMLSSIMFTAENGTLYPDQILRDINHSNVALANDFLPFYPGYLFDTHFMERGRFGRLLGLLAHWEQNNSQVISGIGIDDQSAFCIDAQGLGTAFGSGGVYIYKNGSFDSSSGKPIVSNVISHQLQEGDQYQLLDRVLVEGPAEDINVDNAEETLNAYLYLSGVNWINSSSPLLDTIISKPGKYLVVSKTGSDEATSLINHLENQGTSDIVWLETKVSNNENDQVVLRNNMRDTRTVIFIDNNNQSLHDFLVNGPTGELLATHIFRDDMYLFFLGDDAKLAASKYVVNNEANASNAYRGDLTYDQGLGLLKNMVIMPNTYDLNSSDFYENNSLSVLYALGKYGIKRGLYLTDQSVVSFMPGESIKMQSWGEYSSIMVINSAVKAEEFIVEASSLGTRNNFSFDSLQYHVFTDEVSFDVGNSVISNSPDYEYEIPPDDKITSLSQSQSLIEIYPNPASNYIKVLSNESRLWIRLIDAKGKVVLEKELVKSDTIELNESFSGLHFLQIFNASNKTLLSEQKIVLEK